MDSSDATTEQLAWGEQLTTDELLYMRNVYAEVRNDNQALRVGGLPATTSWVRWRKLNRTSTRFGVCRFATFSSQVASLDIHALAFEYGEHLIIAGIANHELCHFVAGFESGHDEYFESLERGWEHYDDWKQAMFMFVGWVRAFNASNPFNARVTHEYKCKSCNKQLLKRGHPYYSLVRCRTCGIHTGLDSTLIYMGEQRTT
jgi:predicted SprT family Zn-dependent metalloprotease